jgi:crotonobetainyl-CoA:carnitine CoA-transferase CaiB-like acyl-CoA transferase
LQDRNAHGIVLATRIRAAGIGRAAALGAAADRVDLLVQRGQSQRQLLLADRRPAERPPVTLSETPAQVRAGPASVGQHTREVLTEAGFDAAAIARLVEAGAIALDGALYAAPVSSA